MPYKYIGRTTNFKGKTLWEIVGNLKNFGVGRVVVRSTFDRYPEPSYNRILKVEALPCPETENMDNMRKVRVFVERTFRGITEPTPALIEGTSYKADYRLLSKLEEQNYCTSREKKPLRVMPRTMEFPPILKEVILREQKLKGEPDNDHLKLEIVYNLNDTSSFRVAKDGEEPDETFDVNMRTLPDISLYKGVKV